MPIPVTDRITRGESGVSPFAPIWEVDAKLSYVTEASIVSRDAIPEWKRLAYMTCYVVETGLSYRLGADTTIGGQVWTEINYGLPNDVLVYDDVFDMAGFIKPELIQNIFLGDSYIVLDEAAMLALTTVSGNFVIQTGDGSVWVKLNDDDPSDISDFAEITYPGAVLSVNGDIGNVVITIANLLAVPQNQTDFDIAVTANATVAGNASAIVTIQSDIGTLQSTKADISYVDTTVLGDTLSDPDANAFMYWNDTASEVQWLKIGTGFEITGDTIASIGSGGTINELDDLQDVIITAPANGQVLTYQAGDWVNTSQTGGHIIKDPAGNPLTARVNLRFLNGLTASDNVPDTEVKLGGALTANTTISTNAFIFAISGEDGISNTILYPVKLTRVTTVAPAAGIGVGLEFEAETAAGENLEIIGKIEAYTTNVGAGTEEAGIRMFGMSNGASRELLNITPGALSTQFGTSSNRMTGLEFWIAASRTVDWDVQSFINFTNSRTDTTTSAGWFSFTKDSVNTTLHTDTLLGLKITSTGNTAAGFGSKFLLVRLDSSTSAPNTAYSQDIYWSDSTQAVGDATLDTFVTQGGSVSAKAYSIYGGTDMQFQVYGPLKTMNFTTGGLPAAASHTYGIVYDTTTNTLKVSDGATWEELGGGGGHAIENSGTPVTVRDNLNITNGLTAVDNTPDTDVKWGGTLSENTSITGSSANRVTFNFATLGNNGAVEIVDTSTDSTITGTSAGVTTMQSGLLVTKTGAIALSNRLNAGLRISNTATNGTNWGIYSYVLGTSSSYAIQGYLGASGFGGAGVRGSTLSSETANNYGIWGEVVSNAGAGGIAGGFTGTRLLYLNQSYIAGDAAAPYMIVANGGALTNLTVSTENTDVNFNLARIVQFATGALATQRAFRIQNPTYAFVGASTLTKAVTLSISGPPIAGTNATITNSYAIDIESGAVRLGAIENDDALTELLARDGTTGRVKYRAVSSISSPSASTTAEGIVEIATEAEVDAGTDTTRSTTAETITKRTRKVSTQNITGAVSIDLSTAEMFLLTLTGNVTSFTFTNEKVGKDYIFVFIKGTTQYTLTWTAAKFSFPFGNAPILTNPTLNGTSGPTYSKDIMTGLCTESGRLDIVSTFDLIKN